MNTAGKNAESKVRFITWTGLVVNLVLVSAKLAAGLMASSQAVVADAFHSFSDLSTDIAVLFGLRFWSAPADKDHPYGHRRIENLITAMIGVSLAAVAVGIAYSAIVTVMEEHEKQPGWPAILVTFISIAGKEWLYRATVSVGRKVKSTAVIANAWHHRSDALSSIPVLAAVAAAAVFPKLAFIDHVGAIVVSFFILKVSWDITIPAFSVLVDHAASEKETESIRKIAMSVEGVKSIHAVRTRKIGTSLHVDLHILVDSSMTVKDGHDISSKVKRELLEKGPDVLDVVVHLEPYSQ